MSHLKFGDKSSIKERDEVDERAGAFKHISGMYASFGRSESGGTCGGCVHFQPLIDINHKSVTGLCRVYNHTFPNRSKNWVKDWPACAKFEAQP